MFNGIVGQINAFEEFKKPLITALLFPRGLHKLDVISVLKLFNFSKMSWSLRMLQ